MIDGAVKQGQKVASEADQAIKIAQAFSEIKKALRYQASEESDFIENAICRLEDIVAVIGAIMNTRSYAGFLSVVHLYVRTHYTKSTCKFVMKQISELFEGSKEQWTHLRAQLTPHSKSDETEASLEEVTLTPEERVAFFKKCIGSWKTARHGDFAKNICQLINIFATIGWVGTGENNPFKFGTLELFNARVWDVQKNSLDFVDMLIDTLGFFLERGYLAFAKGDLSLLMYNDAEAARFEQEFSLLTSCTALLETGRLEDLKTETINGEADFEKRLETIIGQCFAMIQVERNPHMKTVLTNRLVTLKKLRSKLIALQKESPVRIKPYGVSIYGSSSIGKSMINAIVTKVLLDANGFESTQKHIVTLNDSDPYQSEFRTYHNAVTMDDFGNTKAEKYENSPTAKIIDFLNNVPKAALSPIAELKGIIMMRPKLVSVTTNVKTLLANLFSNEPVSILRRFEVHLDVRLRDEWVDPETGGLNASIIGDTFIPDAWIIRLQRVRIIPTKDENQADDFAFDDILPAASLEECLDWMVAHSKEFYVRQEKFVKNVEELYEMKLCEHHRHPKQCAKCLEKVKKMAEEDDDESVASLPPRDVGLASMSEEDFLDQQAVEYEFDADPNEYVDNIEHVPLESAVRRWYENRGVGCAVRKVQSTCKTLMDAFEVHRDEIFKHLCGASLSIAAIFGVVQMYKAARSMREATTIEPKNIEYDVGYNEETDKMFYRYHGREDGVPIVLPSDHEGNWKKVEYTPLPQSHEGQTMSSSEFDHILRKNLAYCTVSNFQTMKKRSCNIFPICGNTWLLPSHMIDEGATVEITVRQGRDDSIGRTFREMVDESKLQRFNDDYMLIRLVNGGSVKDLRKMIVTDKVPFVPGEPMQFMVKNHEGVVNHCIMRTIESKSFKTVKGSLSGFSYKIVGETAEGMCIAPVYTYRRPNVIVGFHLAGQTGTPLGVAGYITVKDINEALEQLDRKNSLHCHSEGTFVTKKYDVDFTPKHEVSNKHAVARLANDDDGQSPNIELFGSHGKGTARFKSNVRQSPISRAVKEEMGIDRLHGPPCATNIGQHWERDINLMAHPKGLFVPNIWNRARLDLESRVLDFLENNKEIMDVTYPLAHDYVMAGADGIAAFSRIPLNTSMGWPLNKTKKLFITTVDREVPGVTEPIDFEDPMFREEIQRIKDTLARGERIHTVFRGNLKDEPTKWEKKKIRVFAGCEVAFTCVVREFYLPIVRLIQNNWIDFECAVGINAHGPQWNELTEYISKFGKDRIIAGDYAAFDKSACPEAMMSAFNVLILIAEKCGYSERDLAIMRGIATEISYPIYELDGVIAQLFGSNPSGHPLTVIINNLMNMLYMRYVYYTLHQNEEVPPFHEVIALMCYGDDNIMSVSEEEKKFKMSAIVPILADVGIKYTKADKTAVSEDDDFQDLSEVEFLKRAFVWNPSFGCWTAALGVSSIAKSLHNQMASKTTPRLEIAAQAIRSANTEFAYHGPEIFNLRHEQLKRVAEKCEMTQLVGELPTLQEIVDRHQNSRLPKPMLKEPILDVHSNESDISSLSTISFDEPTKAEMEVYIQKRAMMERLKQFGREHTKRGKQTLRWLQNFEYEYGPHEVEKHVQRVMEEQMVSPLPPYLSEEHQLTELCTRMENYGFNCLGTNVPLCGDKTLGEIDALFDKIDSETGDRILLVVEAKMCGGRQKGLSQLGKYGLALAIAAPDNCHVRTILMTGRRLEAIGEFGISTYEFPEELAL